AIRPGSPSPPRAVSWRIRVLGSDGHERLGVLLRVEELLRLLRRHLARLLRFRWRLLLRFVLLAGFFRLGWFRLVATGWRLVRLRILLLIRLVLLLWWVLRLLLLVLLSRLLLLLL